jgi:hypothetical protein
MCCKILVTYVHSITQCQASQNIQATGLVSQEHRVSFFAEVGNLLYKILKELSATRINFKPFTVCSELNVVLQSTKRKDFNEGLIIRTTIEPAGYI